MSRFLNAGARFLGQPRFLGRGRPLATPIKDTYPPEDYEGAMAYGVDGVIYYSNGTEWQPPIEEPPIARPNILQPTSEVERAQLRLSPFFSRSGLTQTGMFVQVATDVEFSNILFERNISSTTTNLHQIDQGDGLSSEQTFFWRGKYFGTEGQESRFSRIEPQVYPPLIAKPLAVTPANSLTETLEVSSFGSAFGYQNVETQWEFYDNSDAAGAPVHTQVSTSETSLDTPDIADAGAFWFRTRHVGIFPATGTYAQSDWSAPRRYVQPPLATLVTIDTSLIAGETFSVYLQNAQSVTVDWGDGTVEADITGNGPHEHTYSSEGIYEITVRGEARKIRFGNSPYAGAITRCDAIGFNQGITDFYDMFLNCGNLVFVPSVIPSGVTDFGRCFQGATILNVDLSLWDMSSATSLLWMFRHASSFIQDLGAWDVSKVTNFRGVFDGAAAFDNGGSPSINAWDTSSATSMSNMFFGASSFDQPIGGWDTSAVTNMASMFFGASSFDRDIGSWNVAAVTTFGNMFYNATVFNNGGSSSIANWNTTSATSMNGMFRGAYLFNQPIGLWDVSNVITFNSMFRNANAFNQNLGPWDITGIQGNGLIAMFYAANSFNNGDNPGIGGWDVSFAADFSSMFYHAPSFNQPLGAWDVSGATQIQSMFRNADSFNQDLGAWDVSNVTDFGLMFRDSGFNNGGSPSIGNWVVTSAINTGHMFYGSPFNQPIGGWNVSGVTSMSYMFALSDFNQDITGWDVSAVTDFSLMFYACPFNQPIGAWVTSSAEDITGMFQNNNTFDQDVSGFDVSSVTNATNFIVNGALSTANYDALLIGWEGQLVQNDVSFHGGNSTYTASGAAATARANLVADHNWTITDGGTA